MLVFSMSYFVC